MPQLTATNVYWLLIAIVAFWAFMRFVVAPKRGAPGLRSLFGREPPLALEGVGREAIATLIADTEKFCLHRADLRGLALAGPFAAKKADAHSTVTLLLFCDDPAKYAGEDWFAFWPYPGRGHVVQGHHIEMRPTEVQHRFRLRGAPPLSLHFVRFEAIEAPESLHAVLVEGAETLTDPAGRVEEIVRRWIDRIVQEKGETA